MTRFGSNLHHFIKKHNKQQRTSFKKHQKHELGAASVFAFCARQTCTISSDRLTPTHTHSPIQN